MPSGRRPRTAPDRAGGFVLRVAAPEARVRE